MMNAPRQFGRGRAAIAAFVLATSAGTAVSGAQERLASSALAGVAFPEQSWAWPDDPTGNKLRTVATAADMFGRSCGRTEFHAWQAAEPAAADALMKRTDPAFKQAGWSYVQSTAVDRVNAHLLVKGDRAIVLTWVQRPEQKALALFLCEAQAPAAPGEAPSQKQAPSQKLGAEPPAGKVPAPKGG